ncbi:LysR family transcriptional regulator [Sporosarcina sp. G11-34]|uniref:LysR family transcriptional regulator n=1 Tax=Sporosarcina sp. G11-34 TaxID=2849605 RepID=UPI0022A90B9D|nr:LysR family transcriptional regulator [Sporosarcina sp. G11-34]
METFISVVQLKSIHKAADVLFLSQPTVSARIKSLERELNTELFVRQGRGLLLTEHGKEFIPYAKQIIQTFEEGKKRMNGRDVQVEIVIGANPITSQYVIPFVLPLWKQSNPLVRFKFVSASNETLFENLLQKKVDVAFIKEMKGNKIQKHQLLDNTLKLVAYPNHSLQYEENISINQLAEEAMVFYECESFDLNRVRKLFEVSQVEAKIEFEVNHLEVAKSIIKKHYAIGFLPYLSVKNELESGELIEIDVAHLIHSEQPVFLTSLHAGTTEQNLLENIKQSIKSFNLIQHELTRS